MKIFPSITNFLFSDKLASDKIAAYQDGILFPLEYSFKNKSNNLVIFFPGAFNRKYIMPKFQRASYFKELPYNCISFFDPTLFLSDSQKFESGWFQGKTTHYYIEAVTKIILEIIKQRNFINSNVLLFATSAGGLTALKVANSLPKCKVFVGNIQTNILNHMASRRDRMLAISYPNLSLEEIDEKYYDRLSILEDLPDIDLFYAQNIADDFHIKNHYLPYLKKFKSHNTITRLETVLYKHDASGHNPLPKEYEINVINSIYTTNSIAEVYNEIFISKENLNKKTNISE